MTNPKKPNLVGTGVQKGLLKTPVYDADHVDALLKAEREKHADIAKAVAKLVKLKEQG